MLNLRFSSEPNKFNDALKEYERIWGDRGEEIVSALEAESGLSFSTSAIDVIVYEGPSFSGDGDKPMKLRASYSRNTKLATLAHELGHILLSDYGIELKKGQDIHDILFLFLYDAWVQLEDEEFAKEQVGVEKGRGQRYVQSWQKCLSLSKEDRRSKLKELT